MAICVVHQSFACTLVLSVQPVRLVHDAVIKHDLSAHKIKDYSNLISEDRLVLIVHFHAKMHIQCPMPDL